MLDQGQTNVVGASGLQVPDDIGEAGAGNDYSHTGSSPLKLLLAAMVVVLDGLASAVKMPVRLATTAALPAGTYLGGVFTVTATGVLTIDGQTVNLNDRILVWSQASNIQNGLYICTVPGAVGVNAQLARSSDADDSVDFSPGFVVATGPDGSAYPNKMFMFDGVDNFVLDTSAVVFGLVLATASASAITFQRMVTIDHTVDLASVAATTFDKNIGGVMPTGAVLTGLVAGPVVDFDDATHSTYVLTAGTSAGGNQVGTSMNVAAGQAGFPKAFGAGAQGYPAAPIGGSQLSVRLTGGVLLNTTTAGSVTVTVYWTVPVAG